MDTYRILIVEDDPAIGQSLIDGFRNHGFEPHLCTTGSSGIDFAQTHAPHLIVLDIRLPDGSGFDFCRQIRQLGLRQPIVMLTAQHDELDKVLGLEMGADDYMTKPFSTPELLARIRAALRRVPVTQSAPIKMRVGSLSIDFGARTISNAGKASHLTPKELDLLRYLIQHANQSVSHRELLQAVWGPDYGDQVDYLRAIVKNLRKKVEANPEEPQYVITQPWIGYRFNGAPEIE